MTDLAKCVCLKCTLTYEAKAGPTQCPGCGHAYVKWLSRSALVKHGTKEKVDRV